MSKAVEITLDLPRKLKYSVNAMAEIENEFPNRSFQEIFSGHAPFNLAITLVWIGLRHGGTKFTPKMGKTKLEQKEFVGELIQEHWISKGRDLAELIDKITEALQLAGLLAKSDPDAEEGEEEDNSPNPL